MEFGYVIQDRGASITNEVKAYLNFVEYDCIYHLVPRPKEDLHVMLVELNEDVALVWQI